MTTCRAEPVEAPLSDAMAALLAALHDRCFADADGADWSAAALRTILAAPGARAWLAVTDGAPCGLILARAAGDDGEILTFGVLPEDRRHGYGQRLMASVAQWAHDAALVRLVLEVAETNQAARAFYERCGFTESGRRPGYYTTVGGRIDALVLSAAPGQILRRTAVATDKNISK